MYAGVAVLEAIEEDQLQLHAHEVGSYLIHQLQGLQKVMQPTSCLSNTLLTLIIQAAGMQADGMQSAAGPYKVESVETATVM